MRDWLTILWGRLRGVDITIIHTYPVEERFLLLEARIEKIKKYARVLELRIGKLEGGEG